MILRSLTHTQKRLRSVCSLSNMFGCETVLLSSLVHSWPQKKKHIFPEAVLFFPVCHGNCSSGPHRSGVEPPLSLSLCLFTSGSWSEEEECCSGRYACMTAGILSELCPVFVVFPKGLSLVARSVLVCVTPQLSPN